ncbi:MAG TPA: DNA/RNA nuclease SfsA [Rhizobiales bacterium]|nr:DNA/RNA nuclease SfsA [Hyphomicrobiales bacterium]
MRLPAPLLRGLLIRRYKRFLADIELDSGEVITAHCANPGSMLGLKTPGQKVWVSRNDNPKRKLKYSWELTEVDDGAGPAMVGINTSAPNTIVHEALIAGIIPELAGYTHIRREVNYGAGSRIDFLLEADGRRPCYVEVKNAHLLRRTGRAEFPDSVTARGTRHLHELLDMVRDGARAMMLYVIQRTDAEVFSLAGDIDPAYAQAFLEARAGGVEACAYACRIDEKEITLGASIPFHAAATAP